MSEGKAAVVLLRKSHLFIHSPRVAFLKELYNVLDFQYSQFASRAEMLEALQYAAQHHTIIALLVASHGHGPIDTEVVELFPRLRIVSNHGAGYDHIDITALTARQIWLTNTPAVVSEATADMTLTLLLCAMRYVVQADQAVRARQWSESVPWGRDPCGKVLGIVGLGAIGRAVCMRARAFNWTIVYHNRTQLPADEEQQLGLTYLSLEQLLQRSDAVTLHTPLTPHTHHLIGRPQFQQLKRGAVFINTSRGAVVDEQALVDALASGQVAHAGLDVFEHEPKVHPDLLASPNVTLLPHIGTHTVECRMKMEALAIDNVLEVLAGRPPCTPVNLQSA